MIYISLCRSFLELKKPETVGPRYLNICNSITYVPDVQNNGNKTLIFPDILSITVMDHLCCVSGGGMSQTSIPGSGVMTVSTRTKYTVVNYDDLQVCLSGGVDLWVFRSVSLWVRSWGCSGPSL